MSEQKKSIQIVKALSKLLLANFGVEIKREDIDNIYLEKKYENEKAREAARATLQWKTVDAHLQEAAKSAQVTLNYRETKTNPSTVTPVTQASKFRVRLARDIAAKECIGRALWSLLFQADYLDHGEPFHDLGQITNPDVRAKLETLSKRSRFLTLIDAGSTTRAAAAQLVAAPIMPIVIRDGSRNFLRMVRPDLVTNSLEIMEVLKEVPHVHGAISAAMIGGEYDWDLHSLSGVSAVQHLMRDQIVADVAVVGITGIREDANGYGFGCDNLSESHLKAAFLERSWLKILIFQSAKLRAGSEVRNLFARLSSKHVDVLITDDNPEHRAEIAALKDHARKAGVEVVLAGSHRRRPTDQPQGDLQDKGLRLRKR